MHTIMRIMRSSLDTPHSTLAYPARPPSHALGMLPTFDAHPPPSCTPPSHAPGTLPGPPKPWTMTALPALGLICALSGAYFTLCANWNTQVSGWGGGEVERVVLEMPCPKS